MLPSIPQQVNELIQDNQGQLSTYPFPPNEAANISQEDRRKLFQWMLNNYLWGQIMERKPFEQQWDKLLSMCRATWKYADTDVDENTRLARQRYSRILDSQGQPSSIDDPNGAINDRIKIADTVIFDAVDRLTNLNHFIAFKEDLPVRYEIPTDMVFPHENEVYSPMSALVKSANAWLKFNAQNQDIYRKHWMTARHHYTYGVSFASSEFVQKIEEIPRRQPDRSFRPQLELTDIGVTYEPMSIRKLWLNWRLSPYKMDYQPCPFFFEEMPRFATVANQYNPQTNPMGFVNLDTLGKGEWLFTGNETESLQQAFASSYPKANIPFSQILAPEYSIELLWTYFPMLPIAILPNPEYQQAQMDAQSSGTSIPPSVSASKLYIEKGPNDEPIPMQRYIMQTFGSNLVAGNQEIIRLQRNFYPHDSLPLYGSAHMPTLDDGAYSPAIGSILENHYIQICKAVSQFLENKDWCNDPPVDIVHNSPALTHPSLNKKGERVPVFSHNDIKRREPFDNTNQTIQFLQTVREQAQTSSKSTDAILGKAMGSRTSATEAGNVFQTAMSGVTTDVNLFNHDLMGGYASRLWEYTGLWVDPDVLAQITGTFGFAIKPQHLLIRLGLKWDTGSQFIESITRQNNIQYLLQSNPPGTPDINRPYLLRELLREWRFRDVDKIVNDGGREQQIQFATEQTIQTYLGQFVMIDPNQDHNIAMRVKTSFLQDHKSYWNTQPETVVNGQKIVQQIQQHQMWIQLQQQQQNLMMQQQALLGGSTDLLQPLQSEVPATNGASPGKTPATAGQARQQTGR